MDSETIYNLIKKYKKDSVTDPLKNVKENTYKYNILRKELPENFKPIFVDTELNKNRDPRYFPKPFKNWGPKGRAKEIKYVIKSLISNLIYFNNNF